MAIRKRRTIIEVARRGADGGLIINDQTRSAIASVMAEDGTVVLAAAAAVTSEIIGKDLVAASESRMTALQRSAASSSVTFGGALSHPNPSLLFSPSGSSDKDGAITPTVDAGVTTESGTYGTAWVFTDNNRVSYPRSLSFDLSRGTILVRMSYPTGTSGYMDIFGTSRASAVHRIRLILRGGYPQATISSVNVRDNDPPHLPENTTFMMGMRFGGGKLDAIRHGSVYGNADFVTPSLAGDWEIGPFADASNQHFSIESILVFQEKLSVVDIARINAIPTAWTRDNVTGQAVSGRTSIGDGSVATGARSVALGHGAVVLDDDAGKIRVDNFEIEPSSGATSSTLSLHAGGTAREIGLQLDNILTVDGLPVIGGGGGNEGTVTEQEKESILLGLSSTSSGLGDVTARVDAFMASPASEAYQVRDRFTDADNTNLADHTPDVGIGSWQVYTGTPTISGNMLEASGTTTAVQGPVGGNAIISLSFICGATDNIGIVFHAVDSSNFQYVLLDLGSNSLRLYSVVAGTSTTEFYLSSVPLTFGSLYTLTVTTYGRTILIKIPGVVERWYDQTALPGLGVGIRFRGDSKVAQFSARQIATPSMPNVPSLTTTNAAAPLDLPIMYGDTQGTHPDVLDFGAAKWNGWRYWMAWTPHTNGNTIRENPSITVSNDGNTWTTPAGLVNPVVPWSGESGSFNSDPDIFVHNNIMYMMARVNNTPNTSDEALYVLESKDGVNWSAPVTVLSNHAGSDLVSPSILYRNGRWHMWHVSTTLPRYSFAHRSAESIYGPWSDPEICAYPAAGPKLVVWHINVIDEKSHLTAIYSSSDREISGSGMDGKLYMLYSYDGIHWSGSATPIMSRSVSGWDDSKLYRSAILATPTGYDLFYSAYGTSGKWNIARVALT